MSDNLDLGTAVYCSKKNQICIWECVVNLLHSIETSASNSNQVRITKECELSIDLQMIEEEYFQEEYFRLEKGGYYDGIC
jgi:hypothetical protein